jgi:hypothetical protein
MEINVKFIKIIHNYFVTASIISFIAFEELILSSSNTLQVINESIASRAANLNGPVIVFAPKIAKNGNTAFATLKDSIYIFFLIYS